jgi:hypothetical protein
MTDIPKHGVNNNGNEKTWSCLTYLTIPFSRLTIDSNRPPFGSQNKSLCNPGTKEPTKSEPNNLCENEIASHREGFFRVICLLHVMPSRLYTSINQKTSDISPLHKTQRDDGHNVLEYFTYQPTPHGESKNPIHTSGTPPKSQSPTNRSTFTGAPAATAA